MTNQDTNPKPGFFARLKSGLSRSAEALGDSITGIFLDKPLDAETIEELKEALQRADLGTALARRFADGIGRERQDYNISPYDIRRLLSAQIFAVLKPVEKPFAIDRGRKPFVVLVAGVNGTGKTTTIGKIAKRLTKDGLRVVLAAGDTFRAAAIEQLQIWGERTNSEVISRPTGSDAAGLAYDAVVRARTVNADVVLIDTAGRLQNKAGLMAELEKIVRVIKKLDASAPHAVLLVLDAMTIMARLIVIGVVVVVFLMMMHLRCRRFFTGGQVILLWMQTARTSGLILAARNVLVDMLHCTPFPTSDACGLVRHLCVFSVWASGCGVCVVLRECVCVASV